VAYPAGCKDANDVLVKHGKDALKAVIENATPFPVEGLFQPNDLKADVLELYDHGVELGHSTGWKVLDRLYTVRPGEMTIVTGIPGSGKSNFCDAMMFNLVKNHDWSFAICSPENWPLPRHMQTLLEKINKKPFFKPGQRLERMTRDEVVDGIGLVNRYFHFIMPESDDLTVDNILAKAKIALFRYGIKGLVIDPWNEIEHNYSGLTETQYISRELTKIRRFAKINGIHVWIVAHPKNLNKSDDGTYKVPTMYEISGGANWRNKADNGLCIHRPNYQTTEVKVYVQKIRFRDVGKVGEASLFFERDTGEYYE
jgi:twinkle protein